MHVALMSPRRTISSYKNLYEQIFGPLMLVALNRAVRNGCLQNTGWKLLIVDNVIKNLNDPLLSSGSFLDLADVA